VGYLQFETGALGASHSAEFSSRYGVNEVMKLSVAPRPKLIMFAEPSVVFYVVESTCNPLTVTADAGGPAQFSAHRSLRNNSLGRLVIISEAVHLSRNSF
jgi:hypothetical protein